MDANLRLGVPADAREYSLGDPAEYHPISGDAEEFIVDGWTGGCGCGRAGRIRMVPLKVSRSTITAQSRGSVNVLVQPENASLEAMATLPSLPSR